MFEPVEIIVDEEMNCVNISVAVILPPTVKSLSIVKSPWIEPDVLTTNPKFGETDAVAEPLAILTASSESADWGILLSCEPSPATEPLNEPVNWSEVILSAVIIGTSKDSDIETLPLNSDFTDSLANTLNIPSVETDAVTEPVVIKFDKSASSTKAERGISNSCSPLPLKNEPLLKNIEPLNIEPLSTEVTLNILSSVDAVTLPLPIKIASLDTKAVIDSWASLESAENGILNKFSPLPE